MTIVPVTKSIFQAGTNMPGVTLMDGDTLNLSANAGIFAAGAGSGSHGILANGAGTTMNLHGDVFSSQAQGIYSPFGNHTISITQTGSVFGHLYGIALLQGGNIITNAGQISSAYGKGIIVASGAGSNTVNNSGYIQSGDDIAISLVGVGNTLNNSGTVEAGDSSVYAVSMAGAVVNTGTIQGHGGLVFLASASNSLFNDGSIVSTNGGAVVVLGTAEKETITNSGLLQAAGEYAVLLGGGADTYDGRGGQVIGRVLGDLGADTLYGGGFVDRLEGEFDNDHINGGGLGDYIDGGAGYDFARYDFATSGVQARLDNAALNTGEAAGDTMYNFEGLVGSQHGDILIGNEAAQGNQIYGLGGNDTIRGNGGADILYGNAGADSIFTGAGTDTVWIQAADRIATQQDRVFDFTDGQDHLRFQGISAASATITDSQGGALMQFNVAGGQYSVFLDGITKAAALDQIFFV